MGWIDGGALAATSSASTAVTSTSTSTAAAAVRPRTPADTATPVRAGEKTLTCADWATAKAGALKAVPGGTAYRVETTRTAQHTRRTSPRPMARTLTVKFDKNFDFTAVQNGSGAGGPGGGMGHRRPGATLRPPAEQNADRPPAAPHPARSRRCHAPVTGDAWRPERCDPLRPMLRSGRLVSRPQWCGRRAGSRWPKRPLGGQPEVP